MSGIKALICTFLFVLSATVSAAEPQYVKIIGTVDSVNPGSYMINVSGTNYRFSSSTAFRDRSKKKIFASQLRTGNQVMIEFAETSGGPATVRSLQLLASKPVSH